MLDLEVQAVALAATLAVMVLTWMASLRMRDASIADIAWGITFVAAAWSVHAVGPGAGDRSLLIAVLVSLWGLRLAAHIAARHDGEDRRYRAMRERHGDRFARRSLVSVFTLQAVVAWLVSAPIQVAATDPTPQGIGILALIGSCIAVAGFAIESIADLQLTRFLSRRERSGSGGGEVLDTGLWRYSRHPNYFGDAVFWFGVWTIALETGSAWWTVIGPVLMTFFLLRVSGVALTEKTIGERRPGYSEYVERTSAFVPLPPRGERQPRR